MENNTYQPTDRSFVNTIAHIELILDKVAKVRIVSWENKLIDIPKNQIPIEATNDSLWFVIANTDAHTEAQLIIRSWEPTPPIPDDILDDILFQNITHTQTIPNNTPNKNT